MKLPPASLIIYATRSKIVVNSFFAVLQKGVNINYLSLILFSFLFLHFCPPPCLCCSSCRWIQSLPEALAHWPVLERVHDRQVLVSRLVSPEALRPAGVQHCPGFRQSPEDREETVHPEQTLSQTTSHQSPQRKVTHWDTLAGNKLNEEGIICHYREFWRLLCADSLQL